MTRNVAASPPCLNFITSTFRTLGMCRNGVAFVVCGVRVVARMCVCVNVCVWCVFVRVWVYVLASTEFGVPLEDHLSYLCVVALSKNVCHVSKDSGNTHKRAQGGVLALKRIGTATRNRLCMST